VFGNGQPVWTVSLVSPRNSRPSEIKRRDFLERKGGVEAVVLTTESASGANQEGANVGRRSYEWESQAWGGEIRSAISLPPPRRAHAAWRTNLRGEAVRGALERVPGGDLAVDRRPIPSVRRRFRQDFLLWSARGHAWRRRAWPTAAALAVADRACHCRRRHAGDPSHNPATPLGTGGSCDTAERPRRWIGARGRPAAGSARAIAFGWCA
jgi:hypothetical protein